MIYVAFYKSKGKLFNRLIRAWQWLNREKYWYVSHVELLRDYDVATDTWKCYSSSAMDGGVRIKNIRIDSAKWELIPFDPALGGRCDEWMAAHIGKKYDWLGIFGQVFKRVGQNESKFYCNEAIQGMLGLIGNYNPASLLLALKNAPYSE